MPSIIRTMQLFNYSPCSGGVCYGISMMAAQAALRKNNEVFANRIEFIRNCTEAQIETIKNSKKDDKEFAKKLDLLCFFDGISMYQGVDSVNAEFKSVVPQRQSMRETRKIIKSKIFKNDDQFVYPQIKTRLINVYTREEFLHFVRVVKQYFGTQPFSIKMSHSPESHSNLIGFDGNKWLSVDHDSVVCGEDNFEDLQKVVDNILQRELCVTGRMVALFDLLRPTAWHIHLKPLMPLGVQKLSLKKLIRSFNKDTISHLLACYVSVYRYEDYLKTLHKISSLTLTENEKKEFIESKRTNDITALHCAALSGEKNIFKRILKTMDEFGLSFETKISIINKKSNEGTTILYEAAELGNKSIIKILINLSSAINDQKLKADFLNAGKSALLIAVKKGHKDVTKALIKGITSIENKKARTQLLTAINKEGQSILSIAEQLSDKGIIKLLQTALIASNFK